ncbi:MAG: hypothetical protein JXA09_03980 [Anaerolineae bacterium]|nr:hypothetical protein [Anaerolineae bacterium]
MPKAATAAQIEQARTALQIRNPIYRAEVYDDGAIVLYVVGFYAPVRYREASLSIPRDEAPRDTKDKPRSRQARKAQT